MSKLISVIPNVCEGKDINIITHMQDRLKTVDQLTILDVSMDKTRNRTVFAFTGPKEAIFEGGFILYEEALHSIDMRRHKGEYPRIGAVDVFPFVPLVGASIDEAKQWADEFAEAVSKKFQIPVYMFGESARLPLRKDVESIRACQYEGLEEQLKDPRWRPDLGTDVFKPDFGATIIGSRYPLVSFKIHLNTTDIEITRKIADAIQYVSGGLRHVSANPGVVEDGFRHTQITASISNYSITPIYKVIEMTRFEARRYAVDIREIEFIGLVPEIVFLQSAMYYMNVSHFDMDRLMEKNIQKHLNEKMSLIG